MSSVPVLDWQPIIGFTNSATVLLDSIIDQNWNVSLYGTGPNNQVIKAQCVIVDNMGNNAIAYFAWGLSRFQIPAYTRRTIYLQKGQQYVNFSVTTGVLTLTFCDYDPQVPEEQNDIATNVSGINQVSGGTSVYTSWNPADKVASLVLSGGNLTVTNNSSTNYNCARALYPKAAGLVYYEMTNGAGFTAIGIANLAFNLTNNPPGDTNALGYYSDGSVSGNGLVLAALPSYGAGDVIRVAINITAARLWVSKVNENWNGSALADPAASVGGISIAYIAGALYPVICENFPGFSTTNFGASPFSGAVPSGFTSGWLQ